MGVKQAKALYVKLRSLNLILGKEELLRDFEQGCDTMRTVFLEDTVKAVQGDQAEVITTAE